MIIENVYSARPVSNLGIAICSFFIYLFFKYLSMQVATKVFLAKMTSGLIMGSQLNILPVGI